MDRVKLLTFLILMGILSFSFPAFLHQAQGLSQVSPNQSSPTLNAPPIDISISKPKIHIAFRDANLIEYGVWDKVNPPVFINVDNSSIGPGRFSRVAHVDTFLDQNKDHHMVYIDSQNRLKYKLNLNPSVVLPIPGLTNTVTAVSIDVDNNNKPYIAAVAGAGGLDRIFISRKVSGKWISTFIQRPYYKTFFVHDGAEFELLVDKSVSPALLHIFYYDKDFPSGQRLRELTVNSNLTFISDKKTIPYNAQLFNAKIYNNIRSIAYTDKSGSSYEDFMADSSNNWIPKSVFKLSNSAQGPAIEILGSFRWVATEGDIDSIVFSTRDAGRNWKTDYSRSVDQNANYLSIDLGLPSLGVSVGYVDSDNQGNYIHIGYAENFFLNQWQSQRVYQGILPDNLNIQTE